MFRQTLYIVLKRMSLSVISEDGKVHSYPCKVGQFGRR